MISFSAAEASSGRTGFLMDGACGQTVWEDRSLERPRAPSEEAAA